MIRFTVPEMSCGHCTAAIETAIKAIDGDARVECNLDDHSVSVASTLSIGALQSAIAEAGYASEPA